MPQAKISPLGTENKRICCRIYSPKFKKLRGEVFGRLDGQTLSLDEMPAFKIRKGDMISPYDPLKGIAYFQSKEAS